MTQREPPNRKIRADNFRNMQTRKANNHAYIRISIDKLQLQYPISCNKCRAINTVADPNVPLGAFRPIVLLWSKGVMLASAKMLSNSQVFKLLPRTLCSHHYPQTILLLFSELIFNSPSHVWVPNSPSSQLILKCLAALSEFGGLVL